MYILIAIILSSPSIEKISTHNTLRECHLVGRQVVSAARPQINSKYACVRTIPMEEGSNESE